MTNQTVEQQASAKKEVKPKGNLRYQRDKDREMVKGIFRFYEVPGGCMKFSFKAYKEDPVENFELYDGQVYSIPLGVARHLNKNLWYPEYEYLAGEKSPTQNVGMKIGRKIRRCSFQSLEFMDTEDIAPEGTRILTVETYGE